MTHEVFQYLMHCRHTVPSSIRGHCIAIRSHCILQKFSHIRTKLCLKVIPVFSDFLPTLHLLLPHPPFLYPPSQSSPCVASLLLLPLRLLLFLFPSILLRFLLCLTLRLFLLLLLYLRIFLRFLIYLPRHLFLLCLHFFRLRDIF